VTGLKGGVWALMSGQELTLEGYNWIIGKGFVQMMPYTLGAGCIGLVDPLDEDHWTLIGLAPDLEAALVEQGAS